MTLPLSLPGIAAGALLVFIPAVGEFVIPDLLGGPNTLMIGKVLWDEFFTNRDWPMASAVAIAMLVVLIVPMGAHPTAAARRDRVSNRLSPFLAVMLAVGYAFLYGPIASLVVYSFNASRLVTVWAGFSTHWYVRAPAQRGDPGRGADQPRDRASPRPAPRCCSARSRAMRCSAIAASAAARSSARSSPRRW